jgi:hypothetical protein
MPVSLIDMKPWLALALIALLAGCKPAIPHSPRIPAVGADFRPEFQKGVCFSHNHALNRGYGSDMARASLTEVRQLGANYVSISPVGYCFNLQDPRIFGYTGEDPTMTPERVRQAIRDAHNAGLKVMLNPHIWIGLYGFPGEWRGDIAMKSDADWKKWFENYRTFILFFAKMAEEEGVELFCVGSELSKTTEMRSDEWRRVITEVRGVYRGPCTYSANWADEFDRIKFWDLLEYAGVSAYFPIGGGTLDARMQEAAKVKDHLAKYSRAWNKPILFVESGFRSLRGSGAQPSSWQDGGGSAPDYEEQRLNYDVWLRTFWDAPCFYGLYWWEWFADLKYEPQPATDFQFRNKPAETLVKSYFAMPDPHSSPK